MTHGWVTGVRGACHLAEILYKTRQGLGPRYLNDNNKECTMSIADLNNVLKIFRGSNLDSDTRKALYQEVLLMVLARASSADANIHEVEVETIQKIVQAETGAELSSQDVRKAARTELYESTPLAKYLRSVRKDMADEDRVRVIKLLAEVIKSDTEVSVLEIDFYNRVADALRITPAELAGLST